MARPRSAAIRDATQTDTQTGCRSEPSSAGNRATVAWLQGFVSTWTEKWVSVGFDT
jgi:hypothetical protein